MYGQQQGYGGYGGGNQYAQNQGGYGGQQQQYGGQQQGAFTAQPSGGEQFTPVNSLNPYCGQWKIKVRVTAKDAVREWSNARGNGKVASVDLLDGFGGEIRATMFNEDVEKHYPQLEVGQAYTIQGGQIKLARKQYTHIKNDYAITFGRDTVVTFCPDAKDISSQTYNFVQMQHLTQMVQQGQQQGQQSNNTYVDVVGVCTGVGEIAEITSTKSGKTFRKMPITLMDQTAAVELTLWGDDCDKYNQASIAGYVICVKAAKVSSFNGVSLSGGTIAVSPPDVQEALSLQTWYKSCGGQMPNVQMLSTQGGGARGNEPLKTFTEVDGEQLGMGNEKGDYFKTIATINRIIHNADGDRRPWYPACAVEGCNKKAIQNGNQWECAQCQNNGKGGIFPAPQLRYILRFSAVDHTGSKFLSCFNDQAEQILGIKADQLNQYLENGNTTEYERVFAAATFTNWEFNCRAKSETYQDEARVKIVARAANRLDFTKDSRRLIEKISQQLA